MNRTRDAIVVCVVILILAAIVFLVLKISPPGPPFGTEPNVFMLICAGFAVVLAVVLIWTGILHEDLERTNRAKNESQSAHVFFATAFLDQKAADRAIREAAENVHKHVAEERSWREANSSPPLSAKPEETERKILHHATLLRDRTEQAITGFWRVVKAAQVMKSDLEYLEHWTDYMTEQYPEEVPSNSDRDASVVEGEQREKAPVPASPGSEV